MNIQAVKPWSAPSKPSDKKPGRPRIWGTQEDINFCLNSCPFIHEGDCRHSVSECRRELKRREAEAVRASKPAPPGMKRLNLELVPAARYDRSPGDEYIRRVVGNTPIYTHVRKGRGTHVWDGRRYREKEGQNGNTVQLI